MVAYPHEREIAKLHQVRVLATNELGAADLGFKKMLALSTVVSYEHALGIEPRETYRDLFWRSYGIIANERIIPPHVLILIFGLAAYLDIADRARLYDHPRVAYATVPAPEKRQQVRALWVKLVDALVASSHGEIEQARTLTQDVRTSLRSARFVRKTFLSLLTTSDLLDALLQPEFTSRLDRAWSYRENFIYASTKKTGDLYHPAGLLDLTALAVCDATRNEYMYRPPFVPIRPLRPLIAEAS